MLETSGQALERDDQAIRITTGVEGERVFIRVAGDGRGIAPEDLANIRTPFFTTKRTEGGAGLGVPVSDRIAREHGGELTFESEPGRGTTATLWLLITRGKTFGELYLAAAERFSAPDDFAF